VKEFKEKFNEMQSNLRKLDKIYNKTKKVVEYVLCIDAMMASSIRPLIEKEIITVGYNMITWQIGSIIPPHRLTIVYPSETVVESAAHKLIHGEKEFNNYLRKSTILLDGPVDFFPQSHPVTKLKAFLIFFKSQQIKNKISQISQKYYFSKNDLFNYYKSQIIN
jgi:hypothetical protein